MFKFLKKLNIKNIRSFDTITTKLLLLIVFTTIIPLFAVTNFSIKILSSQMISKPSIQLEKQEEKISKKQLADNYINLITTLFIVSLFVAIGFAIFFSRKITTPILNLMQAASIISSGNLDHKVPIKGSDEVAKLGQVFNIMTKNLKQQQQLRDNFIAALTHDLKVPMLAENQTIKYLLKETYGPITEEQKEVLEIIKSTNNSSLEMVGTLLDVYKYDMGKTNLSKETINLTELLTDCINEIKSLTLEKNLSINTDFAQDKIFIDADKIEIQRVFHNILSNAINNSLYSGNITCKIDYYKEDKIYSQLDKEYQNSTLQEQLNLKDKVLISFIDNGIGISKEDCSHLFKRFSLSKGRKPAGTGIGLYFSLQVISKHEGEIWCESTKGDGSRFNILLPLAQVKATKDYENVQ